jgi:hypothetical protein
MRRKTEIIAAIIVFILSTVTFVAWAENQGASVNEGSKKVVVEIDYDSVRPSRTVEVSFIKGKTVLEILQTVATVETHPVGQYVFVTSIDGIEGKRGKMAWYYTIDGKSPRELAYSKIVDGAQHIKWTYMKDVCSEKVDGKLNPQKGGEIN